MTDEYPACHSFLDAYATLELTQHVLCAGNTKCTSFLDVELLNNSIVNNHSVTLAALAHAEARAVHLKAHRLGEVAIAIGQHADLAVRLLILAPGVHHERVIDGDAGDFVDALGLQCVEILHEARDVLGRASRREGAR